MIYYIKVVDVIGRMSSRVGILFGTLLKGMVLAVISYGGITLLAKIS